ncbi:MAG TPA: hypothetical protein VLA52_06245 [Thermohalobaculum sp.]|nr:hypothetical protein [Thermohalobaculum sp.]
MIAQSKFPKRVFRFLRGPCAEAPRWREHAAMFDRAHLLVQMFYVLSLFKFYSAARGFWPMPPVETMDLLWPLWWLEYAGTQAGAFILSNLFIVAGVGGIIFWRYLPMRILVSVALLQHAAHSSSFGAINHGFHEWFWISVCLWFLPNGSYDTLRVSRAARVQFLTAIAAAAGLILLFYSLSGLWKCSTAFLQLVTGEFGGFSPYAMTKTVVTRAMWTNSDPLWGGLVINWPLLGWPMYVGLYYVELVAIFIIFRPVLLRAWGIILILFHIGTFTFLDIIFPDHVLINAMFFFLTPIATRNPDWRAMAAALPGLGIPVRMIMGWSANPGRAARVPA